MPSEEDDIDVFPTVSYVGEDVRGLLPTLLPPFVHTVEASAEMWLAPLAPEEEAAAAKALPKRRRQYAAGRACARAALDGLGAPPAGIPRGPGGAPIWPPPAAGSITHCGLYCAASVAWRSDARSIGIDAETATPLSDRSAGRVLTPFERSRLGAQPHDVPWDWAKLALSAKESTYKACYPVAGRRLAFHDVEIVFDAVTWTFVPALRSPGLEALLPVALRGRFGYRSGLIFSALVIGEPGRVSRLRASRP